MKKSLFLAALIASAIFVSCDLNADNKTVATKAALGEPKGRYSYAIGMDMGRAIKQVEADLDYSVVIQGIKDQLDSSRQSLMNDSEFTAALQDFMTEMRNARYVKDSIFMEERKQKAAENLINQKTFLEKNKSELGVVSTESGLQYMMLAEGSGNKAKDGDVISVHYTGALLDGTTFDSSLERNQPLSIALGEGQLIPGWVEMLRLMKKGDKVKAWVPSNLGYGEGGNQVIPGNSVLIFEMELLDITPATK
ncbi:MAG: FKBP-type peptidyl-prolyl cis-trans isomerase [Fibromonadaceae bacterium]|jgi:FKBP-type peptidyl-prolyl cis-trans isomerase|nr:FKBP-type peptidyl-prolyl cis-trans isomerase [Fibromonadaceae bacterium]